MEEGLGGEGVDEALAGALCAWEWERGEGWAWWPMPRPARRLRWRLRDLGMGAKWFQRRWEEAMA